MPNFFQVAIHFHAGHLQPKTLVNSQCSNVAVVNKNDHHMYTLAVQRDAKNL